MQNASIAYIHENSPWQISATIFNIFLKKTIFKKPRCISNPINIEGNNEIASSLIIKKLNQTQDTLVELRKNCLLACTLNIHSVRFQLTF